MGGLKTDRSAVLFEIEIGVGIEPKRRPLIKLGEHCLAIRFRRRHR